MQSLPRKVQKMAAKRHWDGFRGSRHATQVHWITYDRMAAGREVNAYLMGASGAEAAFKPGEAGLPSAHDPIAGERGLAAVGHHGHAFTVSPIAADRALDFALQGGRDAPAEGDVAAFQVAGGEGEGERVIGELGLGDDHDAGGVLVQPVHDAGALLGADAAEARAAMGEQRVYQGVVGIAGGGMHDQAGGLVEHNQVGVFVENGEGNGLGLRRSRRGRGQIEQVDPARAHGFGRLRDRPLITAQAGILDQSLDAGARQRAQGFGDEAVDPLTGPVGGGDDSNGAGGRGGWRFAVGVHAAMGYADRPASERSTGGCRGVAMRALKIVTIVMGVLIVLGTMTLVVLVARRSAAPSAGGAAMAASAVLDEPAGTRIVGVAAVQDRLAVQLQGGGADRVVIVDPRSGGVVGRISLAR